MSFDIFLMCFHDGEHVPLERPLVAKILNQHAIDPDPTLYNVTYADDGGAFIYGAEDDDVQSLMFNHCGGAIFFATLFELARQTESVIVWPASEPSITVTSATTLAHFPKDFEDGIGPAVVVNSGQELEDYIFRKS